MQNLTVTFIQTSLEWENKEKNFKQFEKIFSSITNTPDIIVLPEMFTTGFTMNTQNLFDLNGQETVQFLLHWSQKINAAICGSVIVKENNRFFNRLLFVTPQKDIYTYDKRHLFRMAKEHHVFSKGLKRTMITYKNWKICPLICYDLRFPVWSRNHDFENHTTQQPVFDLLIYVANWPKARKTAWMDLLKARAHENWCYVCGVNRTGIDGNHIDYAGNSMIVDFKGQILADAEEHENSICTATLDYEALQKFREKFPAYLDKDDFYIQDKH